MKNFEAYKDKIKELGFAIGVDKNNEPVSCSVIACEDCLFHLRTYCQDELLEWFYEEYQKPKIKITLAKKVILENLNKEYKWIAKDRRGDVHAFQNKPQKGSEIWCVVGSWTSDLDRIFKEGLFNFLSWKDEEPTNIKELLENCEVID